MERLHADSIQTRDEERGEKMSEKYWIERGKTYLEGFTKKSLIQRIRYWTQEQVIVGALNQIKKKEVRAVLDAGCGFGRITRILCDVFPYSRIFGVDISDSQLKEAEKRLPRVTFWNRSIIRSRGIIPNQLTVCVEVLMHIEPKEIKKAVKYLTKSNMGYIVTVDWWTEEEVDIWAAKETGFCYLHDYTELFSAHGYELKREKKVPYVNQKLRVWERVK